MQKNASQSAAPDIVKFEPCLTPKTPFSVLMAVYHRDDPVHFFEAIKSVTSDQSLKPNEVILVVDGPVDENLETVIQHWAVHPLANVRVIKSEKNIGLSRALNLGLSQCKYDYVARMDSDDLSEPCRFEEQFAYLAEHPDVALLGSWYLQYDKEMKQCLNDRKVPTDPGEIAEYARRRTPFNHVTAVFKRSAIEAVGGYPTLDSFMEDWWIALRLLKQGYSLVNLPSYHVRVRGDRDFVDRRGGLKYLQCEIANLVAMRREKLMSGSDVTTNLMLRSTVRLVPNWARTGIYKAIRKAA